MGGAFGAGEVRAAAVEASEPLAEAVHGGAFGDERFKAEVGADLDRLRGDDDSQRIGRRFAVGIDDRADSVQGIHTIQRSHASGDQVGCVASPGKRLMNLAGAAYAIDHHAHTANSKVGFLGPGDGIDDPHHGSRQRVRIPYRNEFRLFAGFDPLPQLLTPAQIGSGIQRERFGVPVAGRG